MFSAIPWHRFPVNAENHLRKELVDLPWFDRRINDDLGEENSIRMTKLRSAIDRSNSVEDLVRLKDDVLVIAQGYNRIINEERNMVADFIWRSAPASWKSSGNTSIL